MGCDMRRRAREIVVIEDKSGVGMRRYWDRRIVAFQRGSRRFAKLRPGNLNRPARLII
jgi:hypothetical protein